MANRILRCGNEVDKTCHDIWLAVYIKAITVEAEEESISRADSAVARYVERWVVDVPSGSDSQLYLNALLSAERGFEAHESLLNDRRSQNIGDD